MGGRCTVLQVIWGGRLLGFYLAATRETIAEVGLAKALQSPKKRIKDDGREWPALPIPSVKAQLGSDGTASVTIPQWANLTTLAGMFDASPDTFIGVSGKMVLADLADEFENSAEWQHEVDYAIAELGSDGLKALVPTLEALSRSLSKAAQCSDKEKFRSILENLDFSAFFPNDL